MNRPGILTRLIGHPIGTLAMMGGGGLAIYQWWIGQAGDLVPVIAVLAISTAANAHSRVSEYKNWKRAWDAMGGQGSPPARPGIWRTLGGLIVLGVLAYGLAVADYRDPAIRVTGALFVVGSLGLFGLALTRWRRKRSAASGRRQPDTVVAISLPVPRASPGGKQLYQNLPDYCSRLS